MHVVLKPLLLVAAVNYIVTGPAPEECCKTIELESINSMFVPPTVWIGFLGHPAFERYDLSRLEKLQYGASIMPTPVLEELRERLPAPRLYNCYGQSEIAPLAIVLRPEEHEEGLLASAKRPCLNVETRVVDPEMNDVLAGELGEIVHRSPHLMMGYWEKPEETEEAFAGGWFHSGDLAYLGEGGYLYVVDRTKDVIKAGGVQVAGREVEEALYSHPAVSEGAVIALPDPKWVEAVSAVVALKEGKGPDGALTEELRDHPAGASPPTRSRSTSSSWTTCRATPPARFSNASCANASRAESPRTPRIPGHTTSKGSRCLLQKRSSSRKTCPRGCATA